MRGRCRWSARFWSWKRPRAKPSSTPPGRGRNPAYDAALRDFVTGTLGDQEFIADLERFVAPLVEPGHVNSLAETLLKLTTPGVPDIYQGNELWDLSLVDPDNRRPWISPCASACWQN